MKPWSNRVLLTTLFLSFFLLSACNGIAETATPITETQTPKPWMTATRTITPTYTRYPTLAPRPTGTITPTTELVLDIELDAWLNEMFAQPDCDLPCIWGITPGYTTPGEAYDLLNPHADYVAGDYQFTKANHWAEIFYFERYQIDHQTVIMAVGFLDSPTEEVYLIEIEDFSTYSLGNVLTKYGVPGEIWIDVTGDDPGQSDSIYSTSLIVYYPNLRTILSFDDSDSTSSDGFVTSCFSNSFSVRSWSRNFDQDFMEIFYDQTFVYSNHNYQTLTDAAQMDLLKLHAEALTSTGEICITTPLDIWYQFEEVERDGEGND